MTDKIKRRVDALNAILTPYRRLEPCANGIHWVVMRGSQTMFAGRLSDIEEEVKK